MPSTPASSSPLPGSWAGPPMVPPTWPGLVHHVEFRLLQINQIMRQTRNETRGNTAQQNLSFLVNLANCLYTALNTNVNGYSVHNHGSRADQDIYLLRLRQSIESASTDPARLISVKKHSLRMALISQRLCNALNKGTGSVPQRLHGNLLKEWAELKYIVQATETDADADPQRN